MDVELVKKWIAELRSGNWQQAKGALKRADSFCCLGVLCEISGQGGWQGDQYSPYDSASFGHKYTEMPPDEIVERVGLKIAYIGPEADPKAASFYSEKNDAGATFAEIADELERNLLS